MSFCPIHHNSEGFIGGENYKLLWMRKFVEEYGQKNGQDAKTALMILFKKIEDNIDGLKNMFSEDVIIGYTDENLARLLFVDGCALLYFIENVDSQNPEALGLKFDILTYTWRDVLLLENQLPTKMLEILNEDRGHNIEHSFGNFHSMGNYKRLGKAAVLQDYPNSVHILDYYRAIYLSAAVVRNYNDNVVIESTSKANEHVIDIVQNEEDDEQRVGSTWNTYKSMVGL